MLTKEELKNDTSGIILQPLASDLPFLKMSVCARHGARRGAPDIRRAAVWWPSILFRSKPQWVAS